MKRFVSYFLIVSMLFSLVGTGVCNVAKEEAKAASSYTVTEEDLFYKCPEYLNSYAYDNWFRLCNEAIDDAMEDVSKTDTLVSSYLYTLKGGLSYYAREIGAKLGLNDSSADQLNDALVRELIIDYTNSGLALNKEIEGLHDEFKAIDKAFDWTDEVKKLSIKNTLKNYKYIRLTDAQIDEVIDGFDTSTEAGGDLLNTVGDVMDVTNVILTYIEIYSIEDIILQDIYMYTKDIDSNFSDAVYKVIVSREDVVYHMMTNYMDDKVIDGIVDMATGTSAVGTADKLLGITAWALEKSMACVVPSATKIIEVNMCNSYITMCERIMQRCQLGFIKGNADEATIEKYKMAYGMYISFLKTTMGKAEGCVDSGNGYKKDTLKVRAAALGKSITYDSYIEWCISKAQSDVDAGILVISEDEVVKTTPDGVTIDESYDSTESITAKLSVIMQQYPVGSVWTGTFEGGIQCYGFAKLVFYNLYGVSLGTTYDKSAMYRFYEWSDTVYQVGEVTGSNVTADNVKSLFASAKIGDVIQAYGATYGQHTMIFVGLTDNGIRVYDCNAHLNGDTRDCVINNWEISYATLASNYGTGSSTSLNGISVNRATNYGEIYGDGSDLFYDDSVNFVIEDGVLTKYNGCQNYVRIPFNVTEIGDAAFCGNGMEYIDIPSSVEKIGDSAFQDCRYLRRISIPDSVVSIGEFAFENCQDLMSVKLSKNLADLGKNGFNNCPDLTEIEIPKSLVSCNFSWGDTYVFAGCVSLKSVTFEKGTTKIIPGLFYWCIGLEKVEIPNTVNEIGEGAFSRCYNLKEVKIPDSVTYIGERAFGQCIKLESIEIPKTVEIIEDATFAGCSSLANIKMHDGLKNIGHRAFDECVSLVQIELPESLNNIGQFAFCGCTSLESIEIPDSVVSMGGYIFENCLKLKSVKLPNNIRVLPSMMFYGCENLVSINMPPTLEIIDSGAFENCSGLTEIILPNGVELIGTSAFDGCDNLEKVVIPNTVTWIGNGFKECNKLTISGYTGGLVEKYAIENEIAFVSIGITYDLVNSSISLLDSDTYYYENEKPLIQVTLNGKLVPTDGYLVSYFEKPEWKEVVINITGIAEKGYTGGTAIIYGMKLKTPKEINITELKDGVHIKWNSVYGAEGYKIYRKINGGEYCEIGNTETNNFIDAFAEPNTKYTYRVSAYGSGLVSEYDETGISITTAKDSYIVKFNANGGSVSTASKSVKKKTAIGTLPTPTRTGYTFTGWYTAKSGGTKIATTTAITKDMTLYARWTINKYTVKFNANGGTVGYDSKKITYNTAVGTLPTPKRTGYTFKGWYTAKSGGTKVYTTTKITKGMTLYAKWTANKYTVRFNANGGKVSTTSKKVTYKTKIGTLPTPKRTGYTFKGWYTAKTGGTKVYTSTKITKSRTLYARWSKNKYTVKFNANGGKVSTTSRKVYYGAKVGTMPTPKRTGYTFRGWYTSKTGGSKVSKSKVIKKNTVIYARWTKK